MFRTILFAAACLVAGGLSATELHVRREAAPTGALVALGDVAEILTVDPAEAQRLARIELFPAPPSGSSRLVRASEIRDTLVQRGLDLRQVQFMGASSIWIHGGRGQAAEQPVTAKKVVPAVAQEIVGEKSQVVVALRPLQRGEVIRASDVQLQARDGAADAAIAANIDDVVGRQATRAIASGRAMTLADLQTPQLVQKNEIVTVYARTRGVQVRTSAKALEVGAKGDIIALESLLDRNARFTARVIGTKEVEIFAGAPLVATAPATPATTAAPPTNPSRGSLFGLRVRDEQPSTQNDR